PRTHRRAPLFPYTTLFRSAGPARRAAGCRSAADATEGARMRRGDRRGVVLIFVLWLLVLLGAIVAEVASQARLEAEILSSLRARSEEHTSELQSRENLVCR